MFEIIRNPWENTFMNYVSDSDKSIKVCAPYVKYDIIKQLYSHKKTNVDFSLITSFKLANFHKKSSDIEAMEYILNKNGSIKNHQCLHAKIYIFDNIKAVVTSSNITYSGLNRNFEYGIFSDEKNFVDTIVKDYTNLSDDSLTSEIKISTIYDIKSILKNIPKENAFTYPKLYNNQTKENEKYDDIFTAGNEIIEKSLSGWKLDIFKILSKLDKIVFTLEDVYKNSNILNQLHPSNNTVEAKTRQILQQLRDLGLIEFIGNGTYKKLWL